MVKNNYMSDELKHSTPETYKGFDLIWFIEFNATFKNISAILCRSVLLVEETGVPGENHRPAVSHWQTLSNNVVSPEWDSNSQR